MGRGRHSSAPAPKKRIVAASRTGAPRCWHTPALNRARRQVEDLASAFEGQALSLGVGDEVEDQLTTSWLTPSKWSAKLVQV